MDPLALASLISSLQGKSLADLIHALIAHSAHPLPNGRWTVQTDDKKWGHAVTGHNFGLNANSGVWARWSWTENGTERTVVATDFQGLTLTVDDDDVDKPAFALKVGSEGNFPHAYLIVHLLFDKDGSRHDYRFAGRMS